MATLHPMNGTSLRSSNATHHLRNATLLASAQHDHMHHYDQHHGVQPNPALAVLLVYGIMVRSYWQLILLGMVPSCLTVS